MARDQKRHRNNKYISFHSKLKADDSEPGRVLLRRVDLEADGTYTCEVSSEGTFHTDTAVANLTIVGK